MPKKFVLAVLVVLVVLQITRASGHSRRDIVLPTINALDPIGSIKSFNSYILSLFGGLIKVAQNATAIVDESKKAVGSLVVSVVDSAKKEVKTLVNQTAANIWKAVNNSAMGTAIRIGQCGQKGIHTVAGDAVTTVQKVIACATNQANAIISPALNLVYHSQRGLTLGTQIYANLSSECFPGGFKSINIINFIPALTCTGGKLGSIATTVEDVVMAITTNIQNFQTSVANTRNALFRCPKKALADFVIKIGNTVSTSANCALRINAQ